MSCTCLHRRTFSVEVPRLVRSLSESLVNALVSGVLRQVIENRRPSISRLCHHSDRAYQSTSSEYQKVLATMNTTCSMSRTEYCYDNAVIKGFFGYFKQKWTTLNSIADIQEAQMSEFRDIEMIYNSTKVFQALGFKSPDQIKEEYSVKIAAENWNIRCPPMVGARKTLRLDQSRQDSGHWRDCGEFRRHATQIQSSSTSLRWTPAQVGLSWFR